MRRESETLTLSQLIDESVFAKMSGKRGIKKIVKHSTIFSFWDDVVGTKFSKYTKPISVKGNKLFVSAKSPVIVQELSLYKKKLLEKINSYSMPLGLEVNDIVFSYKDFVVQDTISNHDLEDKPKIIQKDNLKNVDVDNETVNKIQENIQKIKFLNTQQKKSFIEKIIDTYKAKSLQDKI